MNNKIKEHLYELLDMCIRAIRNYDMEDDEHYETLLSLIRYKCMDYVKEFNSTVSGEEE